MDRPQSHRNHSLVSRLLRANRNDSRIPQLHGIAGVAGRLVLGEVMGSQEESSWHLYILAMAHRGVKMKTFRVLWLSVHGTGSTNHHPVHLELNKDKDTVEDGLAGKMGRELQVC
jgi:hypothetical protein